MDSARNAQPTTAAETYRQRRQAIDALLGELGGKLETHARNAAAHPEDWGYPGDLGRVAEVLRDLTSFLG